MKLNPARHTSASQTNLTRLRAVHVAWPNFGSPLWENVLARLATATAAVWMPQ